MIMDQSSWLFCLFDQRQYLHWVWSSEVVVLSSPLEWYSLNDICWEWKQWNPTQRHGTWTSEKAWSLSKCLLFHSFPNGPTSDGKKGSFIVHWFWSRLQVVGLSKEEGKLGMNLDGKWILSSRTEAVRKQTVQFWVLRCCNEWFRSAHKLFSRTVCSENSLLANLNHSFFQWTVQMRTVPSGRSVPIGEDSGPSWLYSRRF